MIRLFSANQDDGLQGAVNKLENIANGSNMRSSTMKTKTMAFQGRTIYDKRHQQRTK
jgi:hypothetical protein